jgi:hypothetical protein
MAAISLEIRRMAGRRRLDVIGADGSASPQKIDAMTGPARTGCPGIGTFSPLPYLGRTSMSRDVKRSGCSC